MLSLFFVARKKKGPTVHVKQLQDISHVVLTRYYDMIDQGLIDLYDTELDTFITKRTSHKLTRRYVCIEETKGFTRCSNKSTIKMRILDDQGVPFDSNTLLVVLLHELSHFLCNRIISNHNDKEYRYIESKLYSIMRDIDPSLIDIAGGIDDRYPMKTTTE